MVIRAEGDHHVILLNGICVADVHNDDTASGRVGFQVHAGEKFSGMSISVKEVRLLEK